MIGSVGLSLVDHGLVVGILIYLRFLKINENRIPVQIGLQELKLRLLNFTGFQPNLDDLHFLVFSLIWLTDG